MTTSASSTFHKVLFSSSTSMIDIPDESIDLVVTSPPYPMVEMWDEIFSNQDQRIKEALDLKDGKLAFSLMHDLLKQVWLELSRVIVPGGIVCINIGDATRTINNNFQLFSNHAIIIQYMNEIGFQSLPGIIWRKPTNSPNKFMGSGMLPPGAYITLEHEHILVFRKGNKRDFSKDLSTTRRESAYFWEERNTWFSDVWDIRGVNQTVTSTSRDRSAAFPFDIAYRLIAMYSIQGDTVLDPFLGTGTTIQAAICLARNSIGFELDVTFQNNIFNEIEELVPKFNLKLEKRIKNHKEFISSRNKKKPSKYKNNTYNFDVVTKQEQSIIFRLITKISKVNNEIVVDYESLPKI